MWGSGAKSEPEAQSHSGCAARPPPLLQQLCPGAPSWDTRSTPSAGRGAFLLGAGLAGAAGPRSAGAAWLVPCPGRGLCRPRFLSSQALPRLSREAGARPCLGARASLTAPGGLEANVARQHGMVRPTVTPENDGGGSDFFSSRLILFRRRLVPMMSLC